MSRLLTFLSVLLAAACAGPSPARIPFARALAEGVPRQAEDLQASRPLAEALAGFAQRTAALRSGLARGGSMPPAYAAAWAEVLDQVDVLVASPPGQASALDLARTRVVLETTLESDIGLFGDLPEALGRRLTRSLTAVATRLGRLLERPARRVTLADLRWPTSPVVVTSSWGDREHPLHGGVHFHAGVDLAADRAQPVYAAGPGTVVFSGWNGGHGKQVELQHDGHLVTRYSHLQSLLVSPGQVVRRGQLLALAGETGMVTGPHLHFEVRLDGEPLDPESTLAPPGPTTHASVSR
jgi:murein DD-endopeptidase MepM/ murein hydrolase activator NlpD